MEGPYWILLVCPGSTTDKVILQAWSKTYEERDDFESNSYYDNYTDHAGWSEHWSARSNSFWTSSPANKLVGSSNVISVH